MVKGEDAFLLSFGLFLGGELLVSEMVSAGFLILSSLYILATIQTWQDKCDQFSSLQLLEELEVVSQQLCDLAQRLKSRTDQAGGRKPVFCWLFQCKTPSF